MEAWRCRIAATESDARICIDKYSAHTYPVYMANITLSIDEDLLNRSRSYARSRGTSLNALVRSLLSNFTSTPDTSVDFLIERLKKSSGDSKGVKISRGELHRY